MVSLKEVCSYTITLEARYNIDQTSTMISVPKDILTISYVSFKTRNMKIELSILELELLKKILDISSKISTYQSIFKTMMSIILLSILKSSNS